MAKSAFLTKQDRRVYVSSLVQAGEFCAAEKIAHIEELRLQALNTVSQLERAPMAYARDIDASDKLARARQDARALSHILILVKNTMGDLNRDISGALFLNDKAEKAEIDKRIDVISKNAKKEYDHERYLQKKQEKEAENE